MIVKRTPEREALRQDAIQLRRELGWSERQIVSHLSLPKTTVHRWLDVDQVIATDVDQNGRAVHIPEPGVVHIADAIAGMNSLGHSSVRMSEKYVRMSLVDLQKAHGEFGALATLMTMEPATPEPELPELTLPAGPAWKAGG